MKEEQGACGVEMSADQLAGLTEAERASLIAALMTGKPLKT
ncbi:hypothetical protein [Zavarzinella formosa]|nr:hypothetical protein [Zavarzinella formosa]